MNAKPAVLDDEKSIYATDKGGELKSILSYPKALTTT